MHRTQSNTAHSFFVHISGDHRDLHSFPTRRSSDLAAGRSQNARSSVPTFFRGSIVPTASRYRGGSPSRSEEHTSELQSRFDLVCRLLLEKKNGKMITNETIVNNYRLNIHDCEVAKL